MAKKTVCGTIVAPLATAIWLIDNTSLTFKQIGDFCNFTETETKFIADGVIGRGIQPANPIKNGNLTKEEIANRERDGKPLQSAFISLNGININIQKKKKYIPMLQRKSRPNVILWLINYYPDLSDSQIIKLIRTTKNMVQAIRDKSYPGYNELVAKDPVILGFCSQTDIDMAISTMNNRTKGDRLDQDDAEHNKNIENDKQTKKIRKINVNKVKIEKSKEVEQGEEIEQKEKNEKKNKINTKAKSDTVKSKESKSKDVTKKNKKKDEKNNVKNIKTSKDCLSKGTNTKQVVKKNSSKEEAAKKTDKKKGAVIKEKNSKKIAKKK